MILIQDNQNHMNKTRYILAVLLMALAAIGAYAQQPSGEGIPPVRWRTTIRMTGDTEGVVTFRAIILPGWHLYGLELPQGGPKPTTFDLSDSRGVEFAGPLTAERAPLEVEDPMFGMTLSWWDANVRFSVPFRLNNVAVQPVIKASITYMTCDGTTCRPPKTENISVRVAPTAH